MKTYAYAVLAASLVFSGVGLFADKDGKDEPLRIGKEESVNSEGVKLKVFKDAQMRPLAAVKAVGYKYKKKTGERVCDIFMARDLWFASQCLAMWECKSGKIYLAQMTLEPPEAGRQESMDEYNAWKESAKMDASSGKMEAWLACLAEADLDGAPVPLKAGAFGVEVKSYPLRAGVGNGKMLYVVSNAKNREQTYALLYDVSDSKEPAKSARKIADQSASSVSFFKEKEGAEAPKQMSSVKQKKDWTEKYIQSRAQVIENLKNIKDWWYLETDNFIIVSNITKRPSIAGIQSQVEANRAVYAKLFPPLVPIDAVSVVRVFSKRDEYVKYVPKEANYSAGIWMPGAKELAISSVEEWAKGAKGSEMMSGTIAHEGFHQYLHYATGQIDNAMWFNEGTAEVFSGLKIKANGKAEIDMPDYDYEHIVKDAMKSPSANLQRLVKMDREEFYDEKTRSNNYACAHAFMYFLYKGVQVMKGKESYSEIPGRYYKTACETHSAGKAVEAAFQGVDMKALEADWKSFWESKTLYSRSKMAEFKPVIDAPPAK